VLLLAFDTSTRLASVAIGSENAVLFENEREATTHSEVLLPLIIEGLRSVGRTMSDVDAVVCGQGPGSFTGLRIGMATSKGLCLAAKKPLIGLCSLLPLALAVDTGPAGPKRVVAAILDARRKEVYCGLFRDGALLRPVMLRRPEDLMRELKELSSPLILAGDGALLYRDLFLEGLGEEAILAPENGHVIRARYLVRAALVRAKRKEYDDLFRIVPVYIRGSDARLPASASLS
jgi:tRNA threonylcarbamoyladenosine biosynthesis protein TsaB